MKPKLALVTIDWSPRPGGQLVPLVPIGTGSIEVGPCDGTPGVPVLRRVTAGAVRGSCA